MTKQEFFAMSLRYGLKLLNQNDGIIELSAANANNFTIKDRPLHYGWYDSINNKTTLPILYPFSDITKLIKYKGNVFIPAVHLGFTQLPYKFTKSNIEMATNNLKLGEAISLIEWHFDIAGLIEKGEAIDVNSLKENPYK